jgi:predicted TIM-barrel fold metal-dependent hydrolase
MSRLTQGPDPHPKKPKLKAPPGACDTHIPLFGPSAKYPFAAINPYTSRDALPEDLFALQEVLGLSTAVIVSPGAFVKHAPQRMLWGSDWPHVNLNDRKMPNDGDLLDLLAEWVPDETLRNRILVQNANELYGFS